MNNSYNHSTINNDNRYSNNLVKNIKIIRNESGYGFTLSRLSLNDSQTNPSYQQKGSLVSSASNSSFQQSKANSNSSEINPHEIVIVKHVKVGGAAYLAGLREGDRPIYMNNIPLSDKSYNEITSIIEQSGIVLDLKVISSLSSTDQNSYKPTGIAQSSHSIPNSSLTETTDVTQAKVNFNSSSLPIINPNKKSIGLGSLGMSALFYSFLKSNTKHNSTHSPVDSGYDSRHDSTYNTPSISNNKTNTSLYPSIEMEKFTPSKQSQLAQIKLKNLQDTIAKNYSKEDFSNYGIVIPSQSKIFSTNDKENFNRQQQQQFNNFTNGGSIDNPIKSTYSEGSPVGMYRNQDYRYSTYSTSRTNEDQKSKLYSNPFYYDTKLNPKPEQQKSHPFFQTDLNNIQTNRQNIYNREQSPSVNNPYSYQSRTPVHSTSPPSVALSPVSLLSSNSVLSSSSVTSSNSSNSTISQTQTNTTSTLNYFHDCESSLIGSSFNLNKSSPTMFSKYIETVHKALYDTGNPKLNDTQLRYRSLSAASSDLTAQDFPLNRPKIVTNNQETLNSQQVSKQFVEHRRQIFEKANKIESKSFSDKSLNRKPSLKNQSFSFDETRDLERTPTPSKKFDSFNQGQKPVSLERFSNSSPMRQTKPVTSEIILSKDANPLGDRYLTQFNNRSSYKGECKRLMSKANLETVAERAAHFEDIDPERYLKLKNKFPDFEQNKQNEIHLLLLQHHHHQQKLLQNALKTNQPNRYLSGDYSFQNEISNEPKYTTQGFASSQNFPVQHVNNRTPLGQAQLNYKYQTNMSSSLNKFDSNTLLNHTNTPITNLYEMNDESNYKVMSLSSKRRSITSSPIRKSTASNHNKTSHQLQSFDQYDDDYTKQINDGSKPSKNSKNSNQRSLILNSDAGETTSTDSDIGTSPSGTTIASPPSSPQQPQQQQQYYRTNKTPINYSSIIRQHSYLNAVQLNDFKLNKLMQSNNFLPINENDSKAYDFLNPAQVPYYYSPSSTVMRQQKLLQIQQQQLQQQQQQYPSKLTSTPSIKDQPKERSKSSNRSINTQSLSLSKDEDDYRQAYSDTGKMTPMSRNPRLVDSDTAMSKRVKSVQTQNRHQLQQISIPSYSPQDNDETRRQLKPKKTSDKSNIQKSSNTPQSRNTSIKKLKSFFGEKTPVVLQAVENKNIIASDDFLSQINETIKEGVLNCKVVSKDGKRSTDRSWRPAWAVLKKSGELFLCKEKKDNIMIPSVDTSYPINIKNSLIDIAYDYTKRKNVFKIRSVNSEYLFQTIDHDSMLEWIRIMQENSTNDSIDKLVTSISSQSNKQNWLLNTTESTNSLDYTAYSPNSTQQTPKQLKSMNNSNELINSSPDDSYTRKQLHEHDVSPRRDNRKWVRQMTRRIRDFMTNTNTDSINENVSEDFLIQNRNFGIPLERCEPSTISIFIPVVIEVCTRLIEIHIIDEGIYRKVGQKQVVLALRSQLNTGIMNIDVSDFNWDNPHAVVSLLKCFLNELPDSLTTSSLYNDFIQICRFEHHHIRINGVKKLLNRLPKHNYEALKYLTAHLRRVAAAYQHNKMTIKNLSIAFSQSIIRHNDANCETIRSDHLVQSFLIELILIYHDWLFDQSQTETIPPEIKDSPEQHLSQQFCSYIEPNSYSDLLLNMMKLLKSKWNSANSNLNTPSSSHNSNDSGYYSNPNPARQPINIQFKSEKPSLRSSKSVTTINRSRPTTTQKTSKISKGLSIKQSFMEAKQRSRSVDTRFKPLGFILGFNSSSLNQTVNSYDLETRQTSLNRKKIFKKKCEPKFLDDSLIKLKTYENKQDTLVQKSTPMVRKSYADAIKCKLPPSDTCLINIKELEKKNEADLERLNKLMKRLEIDLINAQMELIEDDYLKSGKNKYLSCSVSSSSSGVVAGSSSSCVSASPMFRTKVNKNSKLCSLSSISSSSEDLSALSPKLNEKKKLVRRHTISGKLENESEQECREDLLNERKKHSKTSQTKIRKLNSKSIAELPSLNSFDKIEPKIDVRKFDKEEQQVKRTILNLSPLSISASSVSSSSSTTSLNPEQNRLRKIAGSNLADEVGSIGLTVSQLSNVVSESLL